MKEYIIDPGCRLDLVLTKQVGGVHTARPFDLRDLSKKYHACATKAHRQKHSKLLHTLSRKLNVVQVDRVGLKPIEALART